MQSVAKSNVSPFLGRKLSITPKYLGVLPPFLRRDAHLHHFRPYLSINITLVPFLPFLYVKSCPIDLGDILSHSQKNRDLAPFFQEKNPFATFFWQFVHFDQFCRYYRHFTLRRSTKFEKKLFKLPLTLKTLGWFMLLRRYVILVSIVSIVLLLNYKENRWYDNWYDNFS